MRHTVPSAPLPQQRHHEPIQRSTSITVYKQPHLTTIHSSALSPLRKVFITESARNKLSSSHHALNSLLFALPLPQRIPRKSRRQRGLEPLGEAPGVVGSAETGSPLRGTHSSLREDFTSLAYLVKMVNGKQLHWYRMGSTCSWSVTPFALNDSVFEESLSGYVLCY